MGCNNNFGGIDDSLLFFFLLLVLIFCGGFSFLGNGSSCTSDDRCRC